MSNATAPVPAAPTKNGDGLSIEGLTVVYRNGHRGLHDATFRLPRGTIAALVGINGAGKSTLFKAMMGLIPSFQGTIRMMGQPVQKALRTNLVAYVPQSEEVDWAFPVRVHDVVMMGRYGHMGFLRRASAQDYAMVSKALARVGMQDFADRQIGELSGGQRKRVFVARALAQAARVILLDEPFTGVDVETEDRMIALLREQREQGCVVLVSTHNLGSVPEFCDQTIFLKKTVLAYGETKDIFVHKNLQEAFGGVLRHFTLEGDALHNDDDPRGISIITDDERPFIRYDGQTRTRDP